MIHSWSLAMMFVLAVTPLWAAPDINLKTEVRVAILKDSKPFQMSIRGKYQIIDPATKNELAKTRRLRKSLVAGFPNGIIIADQRYDAKHIRIVPSKDVAIDIDGKMRRYRGAIDIIHNKDNTFLVINRVDIETYVKGVLYHEVPYYWPLTAIKAQAVATRTYALFRVIEREEEPYDVTSDIYSQVYGGRSAERHRSTIATNRTRGEILKYQGEILPAYFHATCGGTTENVKELWKHDLKPLRGITCEFCTLSPHYRWKKNFRSKDVQGQLIEHGFKLDLIKTISVTERTKRGRAKTLTIKTRKGRSIKIAATRFREIIGPNKLKSNFYDIEMQGYYFDVHGRGWGHGVGMCQWGVYYMAKNRHKYSAILEYYYPGAKIVKISN